MTGFKTKCVDKHSHFILNVQVWSAKDPAYDAYLTRLAALGSCIIVAVDYRLTPDAPFPAGLEDSYMVAKWVSQGGAISSGTSASCQNFSIMMSLLLFTLVSICLLGVPKGNVVVAGDSAGANLSFGVTLKAKIAGEDFVAGLYLICPYSSFVLRDSEEGGKYPSMSEFNGYFLSDGFLEAVRKCKELLIDFVNETHLLTPFW
jgi:acetyl esterase